MRALLAIARRELASYLMAPLGYAIAATFLLLIGFLFNSLIIKLSDPRAPAADLFPELFSHYLTWIVLLLYCAAITMRLVAEERRSSSLESLMTAPVGAGQVILGKFLGAFAFFALLWTPTFSFVYLLSRRVALDLGPIAAGYLGLLLVGGTFLAIGTFASTLTRNQVAAAILGFSISLLLFVSTFFLEGAVPSPAWRQVWSHVSLWNTMMDFGRGLVDSRRIAYCLGLIGWFLTLAASALRLGRWR